MVGCGDDDDDKERAVRMAKTLIELSQDLLNPNPLADGEISPEAMEEIVRRFGRMQRGEGSSVTFEELMEEVRLDVNAILDRLSVE